MSAILICAWRKKKKCLENNIPHLLSSNVNESSVSPSLSLSFQSSSLFNFVCNKLHVYLNNHNYLSALSLLHTLIHTYIHIYIYIYILAELQEIRPDTRVYQAKRLRLENKSTASLQKSKTSPTNVLDMTSSCSGWWGISFGALESVEYNLTAITPRFTLTRSSSTC